MCFMLFLEVESARLITKRIKAKYYNQTQVITASKGKNYINFEFLKLS
jgi:hypothetical protein